MEDEEQCLYILCSCNTAYTLALCLAVRLNQLLPVDITDIQSNYYHPKRFEHAKTRLGRHLGVANLSALRLTYDTTIEIPGGSTGNHHVVIAEVSVPDLFYVRFQEKSFDVWDPELATTPLDISLVKYNCQSNSEDFDGSALLMARTLLGHSEETKTKLWILTYLNKEWRHQVVKRLGSNAQFFQIKWYNLQETLDHDPADGTVVVVDLGGRYHGECHSATQFLRRNFNTNSGGPLKIIRVSNKVKKLQEFFLASSLSLTLHSQPDSVELMIQVKKFLRDCAGHNMAKIAECQLKKDGRFNYSIPSLQQSPQSIGAPELPYTAFNFVARTHSGQYSSMWIEKTITRRYGEFYSLNLSMGQETGPTPQSTYTCIKPKAVSFVECILPFEVIFFLQTGNFWHEYISGRFTPVPGLFQTVTDRRAELVLTPPPSPERNRDHSPKRCTTQILEWMGFV